jgi:hypothetical protein
VTHHLALLRRIDYNETHNLRPEAARLLLLLTTKLDSSHT